MVEQDLEALASEVARLSRELARLRADVSATADAKGRSQRPRRLHQVFLAPPTGSTFTEVDAVGLKVFAAPLDLHDAIRVRSVAWANQKGAGAPGATNIGFAAAVYRLEKRKVFDYKDARAGTPRLAFIRKLGVWGTALSDGGRHEWVLDGPALVLSPDVGQYYVAWVTTGQYSEILCASRHARGPLVGCTTDGVPSEIGDWPASLRVLSQSGSIGVPILALRSNLGTRIFGG